MAKSKATNNEKVNTGTVKGTNNNASTQPVSQTQGNISYRDAINYMVNSGQWSNGSTSVDSPVDVRTVNNNATTNKTPTASDMSASLLESLNNGTLDQNEYAKNLKAYGWLDGNFWYDDGTGAATYDKDTGELLSKYDKNGTYVAGDSAYDNRTGYVSYGDADPTVAAADSYLNNAASAAKGQTKADLLDQIMNEYLNRKEFSYDPTQDTLFQNNLKSSMLAGQTAMQDTMGQAAALTGGYGSTYATSAANQAYNAMIEDAYNNITDYYNMALSQYNAEGDRLMNEYNMVAEQENNEYLRNYQKERDARADYESDRNYNFQVSESEREQSNIDREYETDKEHWDKEYNLSVDKFNEDVRQWKESMDYQQLRDAISDEHWKAEFDESVSEFEREMTYKLEQGQISYEQWKAEFDEKKREWEKEYGLSSYKAYSSGSSGGSSGSSSGSNSSGAEKSKYTDTQLGNIKKGALAAYRKNGEDGLDAYINEQNGIKAFTDDDLAAINEYVTENGDATTSKSKEEWMQEALSMASSYGKGVGGKLLGSDYKYYSVQDILDDFATKLNKDEGISDEDRASIYSALESRLKRIQQS